MEELAEIRKRTDLEIEFRSWFHVYFSIRTLKSSNHMSDRGANRGGCFNLPLEIRFYDMPFAKNARVSAIVPEEYSMSAVDMCMIENIPYD